MGVTAKHLTQDLVVPRFYAAVERTPMIQHTLPCSPAGAVLFVGTMLVSKGGV
jgi:hypothetical protein